MTEWEPLSPLDDPATAEQQFADPHGVRDAQPPMDASAKRLALHELHGDEGAAVDLAHVVDGRDVGVGDGCSGAGLAQEPAPSLVVLGEGLGQDFESDVPAQLLVLGAVDDAHPALANLLDDPKLAEPRAGWGAWVRSDGFRNPRELTQQLVGLRRALVFARAVSRVVRAPLSHSARLRYYLTREHPRKRPHARKEAA